jgi:hypothetical protein
MTSALKHLKEAWLAARLKEAAEKNAPKQRARRNMMYQPIRSAPRNRRSVRRKPVFPQRKSRALPKSTRGRGAKRIIERGWFSPNRLPHLPVRSALLESNRD